MIDLSNDRKSVEIQILGYIRKEQIVPFRVLQHYSHLIIAEGGLSSGGSSGGGSTGTSLTANEVRDAINNSSASKVTAAQIENALNSSTISKLTASDVSGAIQASQLIIDIASTLDSTNQTLVEIKDYLTSSNAKTFVDSELIITGTSQEVLSSADLLEVTIQNKSKDEFIYLTLDNPATLTRSLTLPPLAVVSYDDFLSTMSMHAISEGSSVPAYLYYVSKV